jgi:7-keto-8-aminopelargonate synthetase-like enzyme
VKVWCGIDYLGMGQHPVVPRGTGSRSISGTTVYHKARGAEITAAGTSLPG